ncbi:YoaK family protein [Paucibacter sp. APW11]|uniref:YoaK family protein n=1 Tax=Roseateles aquae TaxID=3077235 RepID=A0ABU3PAI9_9BURK|nr:YoaK family protein [Paucibacter sp. APW11]MDT8999292.1 YoaK family protein [Paucibacter sp. APW11]
MPVQFLRRLTGRHRTLQGNRQLGAVLAFVAGAINAGGFLAVQRYTSHMTGIVSAIADDLVLGQLLLAAAGLTSLAFFVAGAMTTAVLTNWARRRAMHSEYALSLLLEALLLLLFGLVGANLHFWTEFLLPSTVLLLCFLMGLQNAVVTKISRAEIRTTHMTGVITDLGIELGRLVYWNRGGAGLHGMVRADRQRLRLLAGILSLFFAGGITGALAFKHFGFSATVPVALALIVMAARPVMDDISEHLR